MNYDIKTDVRTLSLEEQLARMARQRNALAKLLDDWSLVFGAREDGEDEDEVDELVGHLIAVLKEYAAKRAARPTYQDMQRQIHGVIGNTYVTEGVNILNDDPNSDWVGCKS